MKPRAWLCHAQILNNNSSERVAKDYLNLFQGLHQTIDLKASTSQYDSETKFGRKKTLEDTLKPNPDSGNIQARQTHWD